MHVAINGYRRLNANRMPGDQTHFALVIGERCDKVQSALIDFHIKYHGYFMPARAR